MDNSKLRIWVRLLLVLLVLLDIVLFVEALFFPQVWFKVFHGAEYVDPQGLLRRSGGVWLAFTVLQLIALFKWERKPQWLAVIAGVRLTELFGDWILLAVGESFTVFGRLGFFISPVGNLVFGWFLLYAYRRWVESKPEP